MNKKDYEQVTMHTIVLPLEDIVSTSAITTDIYKTDWSDGDNSREIQG